MKTNLSLRQKQQGVAAIWLALALVPVMGFTFLSVEGTRYIQTSARLNDSLEAAAIAVTIADYRDEGETNKLATDYVKAYVRGAKGIGITSEWEHQEWIEETETPEHIQYSVAASTTHQSWFASQFIPSFDETQVITGQSVAKKYPMFLGDNNIDLMLVSDFSGSMNWRWGSNNSCTNSSCKIEDLKAAVRGLAETALCHKIEKGECSVKVKQANGKYEWETTPDRLDNRIGIVPFNIRTRELVSFNGNAQTVAATQLVYRDDVEPSVADDDYDDVPWDDWRIYSRNYINECVNDPNKCNSDHRYWHQSTWWRGWYEANEDIKRLRHVLVSTNDYWYPDNPNYVDYEGSVNRLLENKVINDSTFYRVKDVSLYQGYGSSNESQFQNVELTNDLITLLGEKYNGKEHEAFGVYDMWANGSTAAFQGMLRGFQLLAAGKPETNDPDEVEAYGNKLKMLFVLTDGQESPNNGILGNLVKAGMCDKARELIPGLFIGVIGIDFQASQQSGYQDCVVDDNLDIIDVTDLDQLKESIEELIRRGAKSNGVTQLY
ncbi:TadE/TadG family type IV pilus assembly protein [Vibrio sp. Sgm 22]|uniref:TadE/TadG family type IV pilus assembly protein n=1 Tax=unclassified Vibrio TaxID=2614977 RepID=UPI003A521D90